MTKLGVVTQRVSMGQSRPISRSGPQRLKKMGSPTYMRTRSIRNSNQVLPGDQTGDQVQTHCERKRALEERTPR